MTFFNETNVRIDVTQKGSADKAVKHIVAKAINLRETLHRVLIATLDHAVLHRDCSPLSNLYNTLPQGVQKVLIKTYVEETTSLKYGKNKSGDMMFLGRGKNNEKIYQINDELTVHTPFYEFNKEPKEPKAYSFKDEYLKLLAKADKKIASGEFSDGDMLLLDAIKTAAFRIINPGIMVETVIEPVEIAAAA